jgi:uncharacterized membrane protein
MRITHPGCIVYKFKDMDSNQISHLNSASYEPRRREINVSTAERVLSAAAGGWFLSSALHGKSPISNGITAAVLLYRGLSGHCPVYSAMGRQLRAQNVNIRTAITIDKPRHEVYAFWRKLENLPLFMKHLESVKQTDSTHSEWKAKIPGLPGFIDWKAEIVRERENSLISWDSLPGADVENAGKIEFWEAGENATLIHATITYRAPLGKAGEELARLFNPAFEKMVKEDLDNFAKVMAGARLEVEFAP